MILYDLTACQPSRSSKRHGGGRYGEVVFLRILERRMTIACYYDSSRWINPELIRAIEKHKTPLYDLQCSSLKDIVSRCGATIIYSSIPWDIIFSCPCKLLFTWHGLRREETPPDAFFWKYKPDSWKSVVKFVLNKYIPVLGQRRPRMESKHILSNRDISFVMVSHHSEKSLRAFYPASKDRDVKVFYSPSTSKDVKLLPKTNEKYFLIVSCNRWEKNSLRAVMALDRLFSMGYLDGYHVRLTGSSDDKCYKYKIVNKERFVFHGYVNDDELEQLYHDAYCLVYPSLNEGFGYPPLEAMHYGVPVLASPFTSIPEVCGDAAIYFNPFSVEEIMSRLLMIADGHLHQTYSERARQRYLLITEKQKADLDALIDYLYEQA